MVPDPVPLSEVRRALVVKLRHHGDVLLSAPVFSALKIAAPHVEIDALVYADTAPMLEGHPAIAQLHGIDRNWKRLGLLGQFAAERALLSALKARQYDLLIHLTEHRRGAWLARSLAPRFSVAPDLPKRGKAWSRRFTHLVAQPGHALRHTVERNLDSLRRIGISPAERRVTMHPGEAATARVAALLAEHGLEPGRYLHFHPASRWHFKCWTAEGWARVIDTLSADGHRIVLSGAPDPAERELVNAITGRLSRPVVDLAGQLSLRELAALAGQARLFAGVDSAPMHIAAAMDTPVVTLFGPSGDREWGPWGCPRTGRHHVVASTRPEHSCRPCGIDGCGGSKISDCLVTLTADQVLAPMRDLLA